MPSEDRPIAEQFGRFARAMGDEYLSRCTALRAGDAWDERLPEVIGAADVFQLFWSRNALASPLVEREWRHALSLGRPQFVRPVYWEEPLPTDPARDLPPDTLRRLYFQKLDGIEAFVPPPPRMPILHASPIGTALADRDPEDERSRHGSLRRRRRGCRPETAGDPSTQPRP